MECKRTDLQKDKKGNYTHKACSKQSTSNAHCRDCCDCKHPEDGSRKRVKCKNKCDKKFKYAPEPSNQYELDSFEIGTESAICEDCGEIHGLDEYEEVIDYANKTGQTQPWKNKKGLTPEQIRKNVEKYNKTKGERRNKYGGRSMYYRDKDGNMRFCSEPIPDYIMRSLKPKKSVHPVYGKLRY